MQRHALVQQKNSVTRQLTEKLFEAHSFACVETPIVYETLYKTFNSKYRASPANTLSFHYFDHRSNKTISKWIINLCYKNLIFRLILFGYASTPVYLFVLTRVKATRVKSLLIAKNISQSAIWNREGVGIPLNNFSRLWKFNKRIARVCVCVFVGLYELDSDW